MGIKIMIELDVESADVTDLYLTRGVLKMIDQGYQEDKIETPEPIIDKLNAINAEITNRNRAELERRLKRARSLRTGLKSREEKAKDVDAEIADLEERLNK